MREPADHERSAEGPGAPERRPAHAAPAAQLLRLQRSAGNQAVNRLLRTMRLARYVDDSELRVNPNANNTEAMRKELERMKSINIESVDPRQRAALKERIEKLTGHIAERADSRLADPGSILLFDGDELVLVGNLNGRWRARSGAPTAAGTFDYSKGRQAQQNAGPIPEGVYWVDPTEYHNMLFRRGSYAAWGGYRLTIHPFHSTNTYGRGGFFIHGGTKWGSIGCIDLAYAVLQFINKVTKVPSGHKVKLVVGYSKASLPEPAEPAQPEINMDWVAP